MIERAELGIAALVAAAILVAGCGAAGEPPPGAEARPGYRAFTMACARCHGNDGRSGRATRIARKTVDITDAGWRSRATPADVERIVREGKGRMRGLAAKLTPEQIREVAVYTLWLSAAADSTARSPEAER